VDPSLGKAKVLSLIGSKKVNKPRQQDDHIDLEEQLVQSPFMKKVVETCQFQMNSSQ